MERPRESLMSLLYVLAALLGGGIGVTVVEMFVR